MDFSRFHRCKFIYLKLQEIEKLLNVTFRYICSVYIVILYVTFLGPLISKSIVLLLITLYNNSPNRKKDT